MPSAPSTRDLRIDFARGFALLLIFTNHVGGLAPGGAPVVFRFSPSNLGFTSGMEIFIGLSGFVFGLVYYRLFMRAPDRPWLRIQAKSLGRCTQLYMANATMLIIVFGLLSLAAMQLAVPMDGVPVPGLITAPLETFSGVLTLHFSGRFFGILPLYIKLLAFMPLVLLLLRRHAVVGLLLSFGVYLFAQYDYYVLGHTTQWNALAYQFLFVLGMWIGSGLARQQVNIARLQRYRHYFVAASVAMIAFGFAHKIGIPAVRQLTGWTFDWYTFQIPGSEREVFGILRLLHFASVVYLVAQVTDKASPFWSSRWASPLVLCGQHSLYVFAFGVVLTYTFALVLQMSPPGTLYLLIVSGWVLHYAYARILQLYKDLAVPKRPSTTPREPASKEAPAQHPLQALDATPITP